MMLPALRADLQLSPSAPALDGSPQWTLADPLRGRYFKLGAQAIRLLKHWALHDTQKVLTAANLEPGEPLTEQSLEEIIKFLRTNDLLSAADAEQRASYAMKSASQKQSLWTQILHKYLFVRIPLWRPDGFLNRTWPWLERFGPGFLRYGLPTVLLLGLFLVLRDWPRFVATFPQLLSLGGAAAFFIALGFAKLCHEFGHAYMAKRAGCRVPSMGIAFMVMLPMLYTDVSDAWRVQDRRTRMLIGAGGMLAELTLACIALLAWSLLPDGALRTAAFMLASATWITTLVINLNPLMRFDGYFLISDYWQVDNLENRSHALCRWRMREALFGYGEPAPEPWSATMQRRLLIWGYCSWLWRAVLFLSIALLVYHFFFKVLGIFLMIVELAWFIGRPVWRELKEWWQRRENAEPYKVALLAGGVFLTVLALIIPWQGSVQIPTQLESTKTHTLYAPIAAKVKALHVEDGQTVEAGALLLELETPDLDARQVIVRREIEILQLQLRRQAGRSETASEAIILEQRLAETVAEYRGLQAQRERLQLRAPHAGVIRDLQRDLNTGRWLDPQEVLVRIIEPAWMLRGYLAEKDLWRVKEGNQGRFIADDPTRRALTVRLDQVDTTGVAYLEIEALGSEQTGPIAVRRDKHQRAEPVQAQYGVRLSAVDPISVQGYPMRGIVVLEGESQSIAVAAWRKIAALGVRESGF